MLGTQVGCDDGPTFEVVKCPVVKIVYNFRVRLYFMVRHELQGVWSRCHEKRFSCDMLSPDHRQSHEKVFYHEETGLENASSAWSWWRCKGGAGEEIMLTFNLFSVEVRRFFFFFFKIQPGLKFWFLFCFTLTQYDVGDLTSTTIKLVGSLQRRCSLAVQSEKLLVVVGFGAKESKHSVNPQCYHVILEFLCVLRSFLWLLLTE